MDFFAPWSGSHIVFRVRAAQCWTYYLEYSMLLNLPKKRFWTIFCPREPSPATKGRTKLGRHLIPHTQIPFCLWQNDSISSLSPHQSQKSCWQNVCLYHLSCLAAPAWNEVVKSVTSWPELSPSGEPMGRIHLQILFRCELSPPPKLQDFLRILMLQIKSLQLKQNILFCLFMGWFSIV